MKTCTCAKVLVFLGFLISAGFFPLAVFTSNAIAQSIVPVAMNNMLFVPDTITITVGTTVKWTNQDSFFHTATSGPAGKPDGIFNSGDMNFNNTYSYTFTKAGVFPYYCVYHLPTMVGTVTVKPAVNVTEEQVIPVPVILYQNAPNPFNGETVLSYDLRNKGDVTLSIYSITGQKIWEQTEKAVNPGRHSMRWSGVSNSGASLSSGIYLYTLRHEGMVSVGKMQYLK
jgi:plastocyanin